MGGFQSREDVIGDYAWSPRPRPTSPFPIEGLESVDDLRGEGSRVNVYKQDPTVKTIGHRQLWVLERVRPGPSTRLVTTKGMQSDYGPTDTSNNYLYNPAINQEAFDSVHTLAVVNHVHWMYRRALKRIKSKKKLAWIFDGPIEIHPLAGRMSNAFYIRGERALKFYYFQDGYKDVKICRSWDVVAHETGHAILDALQPGWIQTDLPETMALHESFGDITAILSILDQMDMCEVIVTHCKGNLRNRANMLAAIGEEFGVGIGKPFGIRNAAEDITISRVTTEMHDLSRVFTGAVYDVLVKVFEESIDIERHQPAEALYFAARHILSLFLVAVLEAPRRNVKFKDLAQIMINKEPDVKFQAVIKHEFTRREIFDEWAKPRVVNMDNTDGSAGDGNEVKCTTVSYNRKCLSKDDNAESLDEIDGGPAEEPSSWATMVPAAMFVIVCIMGIGMAVLWTK